MSKLSFESELKELQDWCRKESDKCMSVPYVPFEDTPNLNAKIIFREYNQKLKDLKEKYGK